MGPKTKELVQVLDQLINLLEDDDQRNWSNWMMQARKWILESDFNGIEKVLLAYGGMGSFNDTYLTKITRENDNFGILRSRAWELATEIKHQYESNT